MSVNSTHAIGGVPTLLPAKTNTGSAASYGHDSEHHSHNAAAHAHQPQHMYMHCPYCHSTFSFFVIQERHPSGIIASRVYIHAMKIPAEHHTIIRNGILEGRTNLMQGIAMY